MAVSRGKINVKAFAEQFEKQGITPMQVKTEDKKHTQNMANSTTQNVSPKRQPTLIKPSASSPPQVSFGRGTLNKHKAELKGRSPGEKSTEEKTEPVILPKPLPRSALGPKPGDKAPVVSPKPGTNVHVPVPGPKPGTTAPFPGPKPGTTAPFPGPKPGARAPFPDPKPAKQTILTQKTEHASLSDNKKINGVATHQQNGEDKPPPQKKTSNLPEGLAMISKLTPVTGKMDKRKSYMKPKLNPIPPEGILGKAPPKPSRPPVIMEVKRDLRAPLPPPPEFAFEIEEEYNDVDVPSSGRPVSMIEPMTEDDELDESDDFYDDVDTSKPAPATRRQDPLPAPPKVSVPALPEEGEIYDDVSDPGEEEGEMEDIYETFDEVTNQSIPRSGSQETLSSTSSKDRDDKELEKQRKKEEKEKKKQEEKEKKEREKKEREEKRKKELEEKEDKKKKKEEEKRVKKVYNLKGNESVLLQGGALRNSSTNEEDSLNLSYKKGEMLYVVRMDGNPQGKWLAKNDTGKYGYVEMGDIDAVSEETYDEAESGAIPPDGIEEETYECVENL
ncbi:uncharacterized protein LOC144436123 isoform X2 [Glandiceps talaboti]